MTSSASVSRIKIFTDPNPREIERQFTDFARSDVVTEIVDTPTLSFSAALQKFMLLVHYRVARADD